MIYSLRTPKQRIETPTANFYNDFGNTLHAERAGENLALAVNLGTSNWTVSDKDELVFFMKDAEDIRMALIDTVTKERRFLPKAPEQYNIIDLIITAERFYASIPGVLLTGKRDSDGSFIWKGIRTIDLGAGYLFTLEDDGRLAYTKRGTCGVFRYDPQTGKKEETPTPKRLWDMLYNHDFMPEYLPPFPGGGFPSIAELCDSFIEVAAAHHVKDVGVRVYALLAYLRQFDVDTADVLNRLLALDWEMQYSELIDEPFPSILLLHRLYQFKTPDEIPVTKLLHRKMTRWSRIFETDKSYARQARMVKF